MFFVQLYNLMMSFSKAWADKVAEPAAAATAQVGGAVQAPPAWTQFVPFVVIIGVFYFFLIRPQAKKQRETQSFLDSLRVGDQVVTTSGILGRVTGLNDQIVTLEIANNVQIKVLKRLILMSQAALAPKKEGQ